MRAGKAVRALPRTLRKKPDTYQHGDLARALVAAGLAQLETRGPDGLSLREAARAAKVTPMAAYHHFEDKSAFLAAVAAAGFAEFARRQHEAARSARSTQEAVLALGRSYVASAQAHPELFRLMVGRGLSGPPGGAFHVARGRMFEVWCEAIARHDPHATPQAIRGKVVSAWATAHGAAALLVEGVSKPEWLGFTTADAMVESMLRFPFEGHEPSGTNSPSSGSKS